MFSGSTPRVPRCPTSKVRPARTPGTARPRQLTRHNASTSTSNATYISTSGTEAKGPGNIAASISSQGRRHLRRTGRNVRRDGFDRMRPLVAWDVVDIPEARKPRPRREWIMVVVQPLASRCVTWAARRRIDPRTVVAAHALLGLAAAGLLTRHAGAALVAAAVLLQLKTLLDNVDGGLARVTGRVTEAGRYLDTGADLIVNIALFAALTRHGPAVPAWLALVLVTLVLSLDFNLEGRYRELRDDPGGAGRTAAAGGPCLDPGPPQGAVPGPVRAPGPLAAEPRSDAVRARLGAP